VAAFWNAFYHHHGWVDVNIDDAYHEPGRVIVSLMWHEYAKRKLEKYVRKRNANLRRARQKGTVTNPYLCGRLDVTAALLN
jgi:hypothetical protein